MPLPIVPEAPGIVVEVRDRDAGRPQKLLRLAAVEACRIIDEHENVVGKTQLLHHHLAHAAEGRQRHQAACQRGRREAEQAGVDLDREGRRMGGARQRVQHVTDPQRIGVRQVEGAAVEAIEMGEMIHRGDDEVDRHDVDPPPFEADHREPRRHGVADLLNELEEVVGAVDLVDLAGLRVADDNSGPIDPPRNAGFGAHEALALVLRGIIGMLEPARLLEHVLAEYALVKPRGRNRADMMETARLDRLGEGERMGDARDVRGDDLRRAPRSGRRRRRDGRNGRSCL